MKLKDFLKIMYLENLGSVRVCSYRDYLQYSLEVVLCKTPCDDIYGFDSNYLDCEIKLVKAESDSISQAPYLYIYIEY